MSDQTAASDLVTIERDQLKTLLKFAARPIPADWAESLQIVSAIMAANKSLASKEPAIAAVSVPRPKMLLALATLMHHRDECHMYRPEHTAVCELVNALHVATYGRPPT